MYKGIIVAVFLTLTGALLWGDISQHNVSVGQTADEQARLDALTGSQIGDLVLQTNKLRVQIGTLQSQLASAQQKAKDLEAKAAEAQKPSEEK